MDSDLIKLKEELKKVKEKYKKKCEILKKANEQISILKTKHKRMQALEHASYFHLKILKDMTSNLEQHVYEVRFIYDSKIYTEPKVESFGSRWIVESLIYFLANKRDIMVLKYQIEILNVKKLW